MFLSFFEYQTMRIEAVKGLPDFIKECGREFMRAFQEEMEYAVYKALVSPSIDINKELDNIEAKYKFNDDMEILLSAVALPVRRAVLIFYSDMIRKSKESKDAADQVREFSMVTMEYMNNSVELYPTPTPEMDEELRQIIHELRELI